MDCGKPAMPTAERDGGAQQGVTPIERMHGTEQVPHESDLLRRGATSGSLLRELLGARPSKISPHLIVPRYCWVSLK